MTTDPTRSRILEVMARGIAARRNPALASDKHWATEVAHYRRMVAEYGDTYFWNSDWTVGDRGIHSWFRFL